ncbi:MAG: GAF domain-containing protein [Anaerolineales bacterium]|nr:GAF domain-containing protein [Anaerolineales bacterium]
MSVPEEQTTRMRETLELLTAARQLMVRSSDQRQLMSDFCQLLVSVRHYPLAWIGLAREGDTVVQPVARAGIQAAYLDSIYITWDNLETGQGPTGTAIRERVAMIVRDVETSPHMVTWLEYLRKHRLASVVAIPMRLGQDSVGALTVYSHDPNAFDSSEVEVLQAAADDLAHGIHRLMVEQQHLLQMRQLDVIRELTEAMISQRHVPTLLQDICRKAAGLLSSTGGAIYLADNERRLLRCVVSIGIGRDYTDTVLPFGEGLAGAVALAGESLIVPDYHAWQNRSSAFEGDHSFAAVIGAPMIWQGQLLGVLDLTRSSDQMPYTQTDVDLLELFANQTAVVLQSARAFEEGHVRLGQLSLLHEITYAALLATDLNQLLLSLADRMCRLVEADGCCIRLWEGEREQAILAAATGAGTNLAEEISPDLGTELALQVLRFGHPIQMEELPAAVRRNDSPAGAAPQPSLLLVPLMTGSEWLGSAEVIFRGGSRLRKADVALAEQGANLVALAIARMRTFERERRHSAALEAVREASLRMTSSLELQPVLETILTSALHMLAADEAQIFLVDKGELRFAAARWAGEQQQEPQARPRPEGIASTAVSRRERIVVPSTLEHPLFEGWNWDGAIIAVPICMGEHVLGVMNVAYLRPHEFSAEELLLLDLLEDQVAIALHNARLYQQMDAERRKQELLYVLMRQISTTLDPTDVLQRALVLITEHLGGKSATACLYDDESGELRIVAGHQLTAFDRLELERLLNTAPGRGLQGWVAAHRLPVLIRDVLQDERWARIPEVDAGGGSALAAPILAGGQLLGVVTIFGDQVFDEGGLEMLEAICQQLGLALLNARRFEQIERNLAELTAVQQVGRVINQRLELRQLLQEVIEQVSSVLGYPRAELLLVDGQELKVEASSGALQEVGTTVPISRGIIGRVAATDQPAFLPDVSQDVDYHAALADTQSEIAVPLHKGGVVVGVLNIESPVRGGLTVSDLRLLTLFADQLSIAIENAALYDRLRQYTSQLENMVAERTAKLAEALQAAREADQLKTRFVADVSHELRTPLTNIRLYLELLATAQGEKAQEYRKTLNRETDRLVDLIEDLLSISRLDAGTAAMTRRPVDLNIMARSLVDDRRRLLADHSIELLFEPQADLPVVYVDEHMLNQVMANLLTNAMNYTPEGGSIRVATRLVPGEADSWITLTVADTGTGILPDEQPRVFERFFRGTASRQLGVPGTGLGLAICQEILRRHQGRITLESAPGMGTAFTIWLPHAPAANHNQPG